MADSVSSTTKLSRRSALAGALAATTTLIVSGGALAEAPIPWVQAPAAPPTPVEQLFRRWARAMVRRLAAEAAAEAADKRYVEDFMPEALFAREEDDPQLLCVLDQFEVHALGRRCFGPDAIEELRRQRDENERGVIYIHALRGADDRAAACSRRRELIAAGEAWWGRLEKEADRVTGRDLAFKESDASIDEYCAISWEAFAEPSDSAAALLLKLRVFEYFWRLDGGEVGIDGLTDQDSPAFRQALDIAVDLMVLIRRAQSEAEDPEADAFRPLGEIAASIEARLAQGRAAS